MDHDSQVITTSESFFVWKIFIFYIHMYIIMFSYQHYHFLAQKYFYYYLIFFRIFFIRFKIYVQRIATLNKLLCKYLGY